MVSWLLTSCIDSVTFLVWIFHSRGQHSICCTFLPIGGSSVSLQLKQHGDLCQHNLSTQKFMSA